VEDSDKAEGVCTVEDNAPVSFEGVEGMLMAFGVETTDTEILEPCMFTKAAYVEWHNSYLAVQKPNHTGSIDPNNPKSSPALTDHCIYPSIDLAPASAAEHTITHNVPHHKAIYILFTANPRPTHLESIKQVLFILSNTPNPPFTHSRTTED
jgi:hypothetical protein